MFRTIANITIEGAVLIVLALAPPSIAAQNSAQRNEKTQTITGCIRRGDAEAAYKLVTKDGVWNLGENKKLNMGRQVDHTAAVRGKIVESFDTKAADKEGTEPKLRGILNVSKITMVSTTCTN